MKKDNEIPKINRKTLNKAIHNPEAAAKAVDLVYVTSDHDGYTRLRKGKKFIYFDGNKIISDKKIFERINKLIIPPAWENVWICKKENGHLQATGYDKLNRKQYIYHRQWSFIRSQTKFYNLLDFGKALTAIRNRLKQDLSNKSYTKEKVLAAVVSLMELTGIRIGNSGYEKLYGSFGVTTLKNKHVKIEGSKLKFSFVGKKGIKHNITINSKKLARIVHACKEIPGKELFTFFDSEGQCRCIDSGMVNNYIKEISGKEFSAKDFRTWVGSTSMISALNKIGSFETQTEMKQKINLALDEVAKALGNTRSVCKKYYVLPVIMQLYEEKKLDNLINNTNMLNFDENENVYSPEEITLLKILEK